MKLIYKNNYGSSYLIENAPNPNCNIQLVIDTIGLFMSIEDLNKLQQIANRSYEPCNCSDCGGKSCNKIWCTNPLIDICLKTNESILGLLEDLIKGTQFMLHMDATLNQHQLKTKDENLNF